MCAKKKSESGTITINRAPVMTLWAAVVAEQLGFDRKEALSLGKGVAGLNAQSKGRRLGIFEPSEETKKKTKKGETFRIDLLGRKVPAKHTDSGIRSLNNDRTVQYTTVERYLEEKFGDAMTELARAYPKDELKDQAYELYVQFRPEVPKGTKGWGAKGELVLDRIRKLAEQA